MALPLGDFNNPLAVQAIEPQITEATPGEVLSATAGAAWDSLPTVRGMGATARSFADGMPVSQGDGTYVSADSMGLPQAPLIQPDEANQKAKAAGARGLTFDKPMAADSAQSIIDQHLTDQQRSDVISRNGNSVLSGGVGRFVTSSLINLADPLNIAAMMIPAAPEAFVAEKLAAAGSAFERAAIRGAAGAVNGAVGMAALEPLDYAMSKSDYNDWTAGDALRNIFMGAALGAGGHMLLGGLFGREHLDPNTSMEATRAAIGQAVEDRPVDVAGIAAQAPVEAAPRLEGDTFAGMMNLKHGSQSPDLRGFEPNYQGDDRYDGDGGSFGGSVVYLDSNGDWTGGKMSGLHLPHIYDVQADFKNALVISPSNVEAVARKFGGPEAEVAAKEATTAWETFNTTNDNADLAAANAASAKLLSGQKLVDAARAAGHDGVIIKGFGTAEQTDAGFAAAAKAYNAGLSVELQDQVLALKPENLKVLSPDEVAARAQQVQAAKDASANDMAQRAMNPPSDPVIDRADRLNQAVATAAPKITGDVDKDLAEATKMVQDLHQQLQTEIASGRIMETQEMRDVMTEADHQENVGKASAGYAACLAGKGF